MSTPFSCWITHRRNGGTNQQLVVHHYDFVLSNYLKRQLRELPFVRDVQEMRSGPQALTILQYRPSLHIPLNNALATIHQLVSDYGIIKALDLSFKNH